MTFGPWLRDVPAVGEVAVVDRFFQTIFGSCSRVAAFASTTIVLSTGLAGAVGPGVAAASQTSRPPSMRAPSPVATRVKVIPSAGGIVTVPASAGAGWKL